MSRGLFSLVLCVAIVLASSTPAAFAAAPQDRPGHVDRALKGRAARSPGATVPVIVQHRGWTVGEAAIVARGGRIRYRLISINALAADVPVRHLDALAREPGVVRVAYDSPMRSTGAATPLSAAQLKTYHAQALNASPLWSAANGAVQGTGVRVAILDSGVGKHGDLSDRVIAEVRAAGGPARDDNGHGTFMAGIIAGRGWGAVGAQDDGHYLGIAPNADVISVKVSDQNGVAHVSDVIAGIEWVLANQRRYNIRVINLSLMQTTAESYKTSALAGAIELAWLRGIVVVVSAGNLGPNTALYPPGNDPYVIVVGATDDMGTLATADDVRATFSSYGTTESGHVRPDLVAPGRRIYATLNEQRSELGTKYPDRQTANGLYIRLSGTSASAPMVTGVVAQLLQARPKLKPDDVKWLLIRTARSLGQPGTGAGYPDALAAVRYTGPIGRANQGLRPNNYVIQWRLLSTGQAGSNTSSWDTSSWDTSSWDTSSWDTSSWDTSSWDTSSWDTSSWDTSSWDTSSWDTSSWDTSSWDLSSWDALAGD